MTWIAVCNVFITASLYLATRAGSTARPDLTSPSFFQRRSFVSYATYTDMLECLSDPALLGCEVMVDTREYVPTEASWRVHDEVSFVTTLYTNETWRVFWPSLTELRLTFDTGQQPSQVCLNSRDSVQLFVENNLSVDAIVLGSHDNKGNYVLLFDSLFTTDIPNSQPSEVRVVISPEHFMCLGSPTSVRASVTTRYPYRYHAPSRCVGWQDCASCMAAGCNWCSWNCHNDCDPLPTWIPEYTWTKRAYENGGGRCGVHSFVCRETIGSYNACQLGRARPRDLVWSLILFVIPLFLLYAVFQLKKNRQRHAKSD